MSVPQEGDPRHCQLCLIRSLGDSGGEEPTVLVGFGRLFIPMPETDGGADFTIVRLDRKKKPVCTRHGAMNKVSEVFWRCVSTSGPKFNPCRAGCQEVR